MSFTFTFSEAIWQHDGPSGWHFVTVPAPVVDEIRARTAGNGRPFGMVAVRATIGATTWSTTLFADTARDAYLLPVKAQVRRREDVGDGDVVEVTIASAA